MRPGDVTSCDWDGESHVGVILATSRHKRTLTADEAAPILAAELINYVGNDEGLREALTARIATQKPYDWHSVTEREINDGTHDCWRECGPGDRCTAGQGAAWWTVLSLSVREAENLDPSVSPSDAPVLRSQTDSQSPPTAQEPS